MRWTDEQLEFYLARYSERDGTLQVSDIPPDDGPESRLQSKIEKWAKEWGRPILSLRQSQHAKHLLPEGWPDITLITPNGKTVFIELKSKHGRRSDAQDKLTLQFLALGHYIHLVTSFKAFLKLMAGT